MQSARTHWVVNCGVVAGMVLSLALIGVSALLNFRMAYRMGDTELDAWIYGGGAASADGLKALLPFFIAWAMYKREYLAVAAASVLFAVMTAYSFSAGMGFAAQLRSYQEEARLGAIGSGYAVRLSYLKCTLRCCAFHIEYFVPILIVLIKNTSFFWRQGARLFYIRRITERFKHGTEY